MPCPVPGEPFGPYRVVRRLGAGGMGIVFEAVEPARSRTVALKVVAPQYVGDPAIRARFASEAQAQAALASPHVVPVLAYGEVDGTPYLASRLVPGGDLGHLLRTRGVPTLATAVDLIGQVASGLATAHARGIVHRDLKPANVLLTSDGSKARAYLTDFGLARVVGVDHGLTTQGFAVGTPSYQAPELHTGAEADARSDVYSLGCLLWATLTGHPPYVGRTDYQLVRAHVEQPVPQLAVSGRCAGAVNRVLRIALAKDPAARYPSAAEMRDELRALPRDGQPASDRLAGAERPRRRRWAVGAATVGAAMLVAASLLLPDGDDRGLTAAERRAADEIAAALVADGGVTEAQATCTARAFVGRTGADPLIEAGMLDAGLHYVADSRIGDPDLLDALTGAALACLPDA